MGQNLGYDNEYFTTPILMIMEWRNYGFLAQDQWVPYERLNFRVEEDIYAETKYTKFLVSISELTLNPTNYLKALNKP